MHNVIINKKKILIHWMMQFSRNNAHYELALRMRTETLDDRQFIPVWEKKNVNSVPPVSDEKST